MEHALYTEEHEAFRDLCRTFFEKECVPHTEQWEHDGIVSRDVWNKAGAAGLLGFNVKEEWGGPGIKDFRYNAVMMEELSKAHVDGPGFTVHNDLLWPYLELCTDEQAERWIPGFMSGDLITAIAMTEPGAGSDLQGIKTTAVEDGDHFILNGSKTFITNGILSDLVVVFAKTDPDAGHLGFSLLVVERGMEGFERGRNLDKMGLKAQDTAELFFNDVKVPKENLLGTRGHGFLHLMNNLPQERLAIAVLAVAAIEETLRMTLEYTTSREAFGKPIARFQNTRFALAEVATEADVARSYVNECIRLHNEGKLDHVDAAKAKWWTTELQKKVVDQCLQLFGGYGYMSEYPISKMYTATRIQTIYGGTTEIMKEIIGRQLTA